MLTLRNAITISLSVIAVATHASCRSPHLSSSSGQSHSASRERMLRETSDGRVWRGQFMDASLGLCTVVNQYKGVDTLGRAYHVDMVDQSNHIVRKGDLLLYEGSVPYCIVRVKSASNEAPPSDRNRWIIAIGALVRSQDIDRKLPLILDEGLKLDEPANYVRIQPIRWLDGPQWKTGFDVLYQTPFDAVLAESVDAW